MSENPEQRSEEGHGLEFHEQREDRIPRGKVNIEVKANFDLDDARIFNLNGEGLTITMVTSN